MRTMLPDEVGGAVSVVCGRPTGRPAVRTAGPPLLRGIGEVAGPSWRALGWAGWCACREGPPPAQCPGAVAEPWSCAPSSTPSTGPLGSDGMKVLVTGGAGYIGSTTAKALEEAGHTPVILDSLLTGPLAFVRDRIFYEGDIADRALLRPDRRRAPRPRRDDPHGGADHGAGVGRAALRVLPRQRRQVAGALRPARRARQAAGAVLLLGVAVRASRTSSRWPRTTRSTRRRRTPAPSG